MGGIDGVEAAAGAADAWDASGPDAWPGNGLDDGLTARTSSCGTGRVDGTAPIGRADGGTVSLLPCVVARKRGERRGGAVVAPLFMAPFTVGGNAAGRASPFTPGRVSPRAS